MEPDVNTPLLPVDESVNRQLYVEDDASSDSGNSADDTFKKRRIRCIKYLLHKTCYMLNYYSTIHMPCSLFYVL